MTGRSSAHEAPWSFGDRVKLASKPEWGIGVVSRAEPIRVKGELAWTVTVRFPNAGIKTLNTAGAVLERVEATTEEGGERLLKPLRMQIVWVTMSCLAQQPKSVLKR